MAKIIFKSCCSSCGESHQVIVDDNDIASYRNGALAQDVFPYLTPSQREFFFQSGLCDDCWDNLFPNEE